MFAHFRQLIEELSTPEGEDAAPRARRQDVAEAAGRAENARQAWQQALDDASAWRPC